MTSKIGMMPLVMMIMLAMASSANMRVPAEKHVKVSMMQAQASTGKVSKVQKNVDAADEDDDKKDQADDDDDSDDDDDDKSDKKDQEAALAEAIHKHKAAKNDVENFEDDKSFDMKVAAEVKLMTSETQSASLSSFLGSLRTEMREYAMPAYPKYLEGRAEAAEKKVAELEKEIAKEDEPAKKEKKAADVKVADVKAKKKDDDKSDKKKEADDKSDKKKAAPEESAAVAAEKGDEEAAVADVAKKGAETWAISFFANVALLSVVFALANAADSAVRANTWFLINQVILIFMAVMYFQAFDSVLDFANLPKEYHVLSSILHALIMLTMVLLLAYSLRKYDVGLSIVCGAGAHIVSFTSIHAGASTQNHVWVSMSYTWMMMVFGMFVLALALFIIGYLVYTAKKRSNMLENDGFMDKTDDLENDFGSMAFSVVFTMFVRFLITGHHPVDDDTDFDHTSEQRIAMFCYACFALICAAFLCRFFAKKAAAAAAANDYAKKRTWNFFTTVTAMNVAWAFLYWGEWTFFEALYPGEAIKGRVMYAITSTVFGGLAIIALAKSSANVPKGDQTTKSAEKVLVTAVGLLVAWSWELCFDAAVETMTEGVAHPVAWKVSTTCSLFAIVIPVYAFYIYPAVNANGAGG